MSASVLVLYGCFVNCIVQVFWMEHPCPIQKMLQLIKQEEVMNLQESEEKKEVFEVDERRI